MSQRTHSLLFFAVLISAWAPEAPLHGQTVPSPFRFIETRQEGGVFLGYRSPGTGRFGFGPSGDYLLGARYGVRLGGPFALEGTVASMPGSRDLVDPTRVEGDRVVGDVDSQVLTLDVRVRFSLVGDRTWHGLNPFVLIGGGGAFETEGEAPEEELLLLPNDRFEFDSSFTGLFGGGLSWHVGDRFLIRTDLIMMMWQIKAPPGFVDPERGLTGVDEKEWVSGPSFTIGTAYRF